ncbi:phage head spike fiber domain-containing protein [Pseudomonas sp. C9-3]|uniref:phage head spike fiber domain-containing protein n=1 Tax=Pseudomonas sp. C9-3 TaxID=3078264 RepID=UPI0028EDB030|nr:hypothetical protein [Pseudomonas sp. C9-3]
MALTQKNLTDLITITRAGAGMRHNALGLLETIPGNEPRFDYDPATRQLRGLLIEEQRTNLFLWSSDLSKSSWNKGGMGVLPGQSSIKGDQSACLLTPLADNSQPQLTQSVAITSGKTYTVSFVVTSAGAGAAYIQLQGATSINSACRVVVNISTGAVAPVAYFGAGFSGATAAAIPLGNNRWRLTLSALITLEGESIRGVLGPSRSSSSAVPVNITDALVVELPQLELGAFASSIIETSAAQATRASDIVALTSLSPWFNPMQGTLYVEASVSSVPVGNAGATGAGITGNVGIAERVIGLQFTATLMRAGGIGTGGADTALFSITGTPLAGKIYKGAAAWAAGDARGAVNGTLSAQITTSPIPGPLSRMSVGAITGGSQLLNGHVRAIRYYPRRLSDVELQALTA